jgi:polysaccharide export outer membrane protein
VIAGSATLVYGAILLGGGIWAQTVQLAADTSRTAAVLGSDDSISVLALNCEEISKEWRIGASGDVTFPMIGRVHLAGMNVEEAERDMASRLRTYLKDPQVTLYISEVRSHPVTVAGAVEKPGKYQISNGSTLFDVLVQAGGPKNAGSRVTVRRSVKDGRIEGVEVKTDKDDISTMAEFDLNSVMDGPDGPGPNANFKMRSFDVVTVAPTAAPRYVHIVGEVTHPGSVELVTQETISLMKVVAVAGGLSHVAAPNRALIMHINLEGVQTSTAVVDIKKIMDGKAKDLDLIAGDIVMVPSSKIKTYAEMMTGTAMNSGLTTAIFTLGKF